MYMVDDARGWVYSDHRKPRRGACTRAQYKPPASLHPPPRPAPDKPPASLVIPFTHIGSAPAVVHIEKMQGWYPSSAKRKCDLSNWHAECFVSVLHEFKIVAGVHASLRREMYLTLSGGSTGAYAVEYMNRPKALIRCGGTTYLCSSTTPSAIRITCQDHLCPSHGKNYACIMMPKNAAEMPQNPALEGKGNGRAL